MKSQKRPFLNQEEGSAKLLSLREPVTRILAPFLKRGRSRWADSGRPRQIVNQEDILDSRLRARQRARDRRNSRDRIQNCQDSVPTGELKSYPASHLAHYGFKSRYERPFAERKSTDFRSPKPELGLR